jgi:hypothetical protein
MLGDTPKSAFEEALEDALDGVLEGALDEPIEEVAEGELKRVDEGAKELTPAVEITDEDAPKAVAGDDVELVRVEEEPGDRGAPCNDAIDDRIEEDALLQFPNPGWHPVPQYAEVEPLNIVGHKDFPQYHGSYIPVRVLRAAVSIYRPSAVESACGTVKVPATSICGDLDCGGGTCGRRRTRV